VRYRLLALDLDGTILDSDGILRPAVQSAIAAARESGLQVVLCTGRRFRTAQPVFAQLGLSGPAVVQNGVVVKDGATGRTLHASYVPSSAYPKALSLLRAVGPPAVYIDDGPGSSVDLVAERGRDPLHPFLAEYLEANRAQTRWVDSLATPPSGAVAMLSAMGERNALEAIEQTLNASPISALRANLIANKSYRGYILELVNCDSGKWERLHEIARAAGIRADQIVAIGDDTNDREMIGKAGLGVAMANADASVREIADHVTESNDNDGAAIAIRELLL
jgi:Cof subfamily protein (haloacid dehalogenase superfamily)